MPVFDTPEALQAHRTVSQRTRDLKVVQDAAEHVEELLSTVLSAEVFATLDHADITPGLADLAALQRRIDPQTGHVTHN